MFEESCVCFKADLRFAVPQFQGLIHQILKTCFWVSLLERFSRFLRMDVLCGTKVLLFMNYYSLAFEFSNYADYLKCN